MNKYLICIMVLIVSAPLVQAVKKFEFTQPTQDELQITMNPLGRDEGAMILLREIILNETYEQDWYEEHVRIKIFSTKGLEHATVEIPSFKKFEITKIKGRTIRKDGSIVELTDANIFEKQWSKGKKEKVLAKTFTFPGAEPGCIVEYIYHQNYLPQYVTKLDIQDDIFTKEFRFLLIPIARYSLGWKGVNISSLVQPERTEDGIRLVIKDIPGFVEEDYSPPEEDIRSTGYFFHTDKPYNTMDDFWNETAKEAFKKHEKFRKQNRLLQEKTKQLINESANKEEALQKFYYFVQGLRNLSMEPDYSRKSEQEITAEYLMNCSCGTAEELNELFATGAYLMGFDSYPGHTLSKHNGTFIKELPSRWQLSDLLAVIKNGDKYRFFSPGNMGLSFEALPGHFSEVPVLLISKQPSFLTTPSAQPKDTITKLDAKVTLKDDGTSTITMNESYTGALAAQMRQIIYDEKEDKVKKDQEEYLKKLYPDIIIDKFAISNQTDSSKPLLITYDYHYKDDSLQAERVIYKLPPFHGREKDMFSTPYRNNALCLDNKHTDVDQIELSLPDKFQLRSLPQNVTLNIPEMNYSMTFSRNEKGNIIVERKLEWNFGCVYLLRYNEMKIFWKQIEKADQVSLMLTTKGGIQ